MPSSEIEFKKYSFHRGKLEYDKKHNKFEQLMKLCVNNKYVQVYKSK